MIYKSIGKYSLIRYALFEVFKIFQFIKNMKKNFHRELWLYYKVALDYFKCLSRNSLISISKLNAYFITRFRLICKTAH